MNQPDEKTNEIDQQHDGLGDFVTLVGRKEGGIGEGGAGKEDRPVSGKPFGIGATSGANPGAAPPGQVPLILLGIAAGLALWNGLKKANAPPDRGR